MMVEMISDEKAGWLHNHVFKYVEDLWERPLAWVCRLFCGELKKENYKRRVHMTEDQEREIRDTQLNLKRYLDLDELQKTEWDESDISLKIRRQTVQNQKDVIQKNRAAKLELALFVTLHVGFELFQRVLDIQKRISLAQFYPMKIKNE